MRRSSVEAGGIGSRADRRAMRRLVRFAAADLVPDAAGILEAQGMSARGEVAPELLHLAEVARAAYLETAEPQAVWEEAAPDALTPMLGSASIVGRILPRARRTALFAGTLGAGISACIAALMADGAIDEGYLLDAVASGAADALSTRLAEAFDLERAEAEERVLPYSPGYCGWPTSGQRALFAALRPEEIGLTLNDSCLMSPIKSVSGVLVSAPAGAHLLPRDLACCADCSSRSCGPRLAAVARTPRSAHSSPCGDAV